MSELDFEVEKISFVVSVLHEIEDTIKTEFFSDHEKQKENLQYIHEILCNIELSGDIMNSEIIKSFLELQLGFKRYIERKDKNISDESLKVIYIIF